MNTLGIIIARAGSVGLSGKHLRPLLGKPVISYTFDHARAASELSRVVVSTDCPQIRLLAAEVGFKTIRRPNRLATSTASVQAALLHTLKSVEDELAFRADAVALLYGNVPVRPPTAIDDALKMLKKTGCDSVRSWCPVGKWHPAWMATLNGDRVVPQRPGSIDRRQDLEPLFLHDGAIVAVTRKALLASEKTPNDPHAFFGSDRRGFVTEPGATVEIDHLRDLYWAEAVLRDKAEPMRRSA